MIIRTINSIFAFILMYSSLVLHCEASDKFQTDIDENVVAKLDQAVELRRIGKLNEAIPLLKSITEEQPIYYRAHYNLALAYTDSDHFEDALAAFKQAEELRANEKIDDPTLDNSIGWAYLLEGNYDEASKYFEAAIQQSDNMSSFSKARLFNNYAQVKIYQGDLATAKLYLEKAIQNGSSIATITLQQVSTMESVQSQ